MPKKMPVTMFHKPENTRVVDSDMELLTAKAIIRGRRVPRSPNDPDTSERGERRRVETLLAWKRRRWESAIASVQSGNAESRGSVGHKSANHSNAPGGEEHAVASGNHIYGREVRSVG